MFKKTLEFINSGVGTAYPCAAVAIGKENEVFAREFFKVDEDTLFDLASLSKLVSTTAIALKFIENGKLSLDDNIGEFLNYTGNFADCKIKHLLTHTSGIPAWLPLFNMQIEKDDVIKTILDTEKSYETLWIHPFIDAYMLKNSGHYFYSEEDMKIILKLFKENLL